MTRLTNKQIILVTAAVIVAVSAWGAYQKRFQMAAHIWQFRHRGLMSFDGYSIPVPANWYVQDGESDIERLFRMDSARGPGKWNPSATMTFMDGPPLQDLDKWTSLVASSFKSQGVEPVLRPGVSVEGETFSCVGGEVLPKAPGKSDPAPVAWHCRSTGRLEILFTGPQSDLNQSWDIISRIRKASKMITDSRSEPIKQGRAQKKRRLLCPALLIDQEQSQSILRNMQA
jgi:hypothetical protein